MYKGIRPETMMHSPETELLLLCARPRIDDELARRITSLAQRELDWKLVFRSAEYYRTIPLLAFHLQRSSGDLLPDAVRSELQERHRASTRHNLVLAMEIHRLKDAFSAENVAVVPFKGPVSATLVYGDMAMRACGDIDLLVRRDDHGKAERILEREGYSVEQRLEEAMQSSLKHEANGIHVDLHWGIPPAKLRLDTQHLWEDLRPVELLGRPVLTFSPCDTLLVTAINVVKEYWRPSLHQLSDIACLTRDYTDQDWDAAFDRAGEIGCQRMLAAAVLLTHRMLDAKLPSTQRLPLLRHPGVRKAVDELQEHLFLPSDDEESAMQLFHHRGAQSYYLTMMDSGWQRNRYWLTRALKPNVADQAFLTLPRKLSFLYVVIRPLRLLIKRL